MTAGRGALKLALILAAVAIAAGALLSPPGLPMGGLRLDLAVHAAAYGLLAGLAALIWPASFLVALGVFGYSLALEAGQLALPARSFDGLDLAANAAGILAGVLLAVVLRRRLSGLS